MNTLSQGAEPGACSRCQRWQSQQEIDPMEPARTMKRTTRASHTTRAGPSSYRSRLRTRCWDKIRWSGQRRDVLQRYETVSARRNPHGAGCRSRDRQRESSSAAHYMGLSKALKQMAQTRWVELQWVRVFRWEWCSALDQRCRPAWWEDCACAFSEAELVASFPYEGGAACSSAMVRYPSASVVDEVRV